MPMGVAGGVNAETGGGYTPSSTSGFYHPEGVFQFAGL
jgi:hypothetical protein